MEDLFWVALVVFFGFIAYLEYEEKKTNQTRKKRNTHSIRSRLYTFGFGARKNETR